MGRSGVGLGGWGGGWGGGKVEEEEAVRMSYCGLGTGGWAGGWIEEDERKQSVTHPPTHPPTHRHTPSTSFEPPRSPLPSHPISTTHPPNYPPNHLPTRKGEGRAPLPPNRVCEEGKPTHLNEHC